MLLLNHSFVLQLVILHLVHLFVSQYLLLVLLKFLYHLKSLDQYQTFVYQYLIALLQHQHLFVLELSLDYHLLLDLQYLYQHMVLTIHFFDQLNYFFHFLNHQEVYFYQLQFQDHFLFVQFGYQHQTFFAQYFLT